MQRLLKESRPLKAGINALLLALEEARPSLGGSQREGLVGKGVASSGKKVVPIFLTVLISVGTALYLGMLSYRPEVVDEKPQAVVKAAPPSSPRAAVAADQDAKRPARTLKIQPVAPPSSAQGNKPESEERDDRQGADESALNAPTQAHNEKPDDDEEDPSAQATAPGRNAPTEGTLDRATIKDLSLIHI